MDSEYNAIFSRKSVRKYKPEHFTEKDMEALTKKLSELTPLIPGAPISFRVLEASRIKGIVSAKAPHYLAVYTDSENSINAAFMLQQMDLWLSANGFGSCWLGMPRPAKELSKLNGLPFAIMLAFGYPAEEPKRAHTSEFNRKPFSGITDIKGRDELLEPVRLAPSGVNRQPWFLKENENAVRLYVKLNGGISKMLFGSLPMFDCGIALCHLWHSSVHAEKFSSFGKEQNVLSPNGFDYVHSVFLKP